MKYRPNTQVTVMDNVSKFKHHGMSFLETLNQTELDDMIVKLNDAYYNKSPLLTDNEYDIVKEHISMKYPEDMVVQQIGAPVGKNKVKLPYEMWSMDKIKPDTNALSGWMSTYTGPYVLSCKLDGVSGLYTTEGTTAKLYTRGDGINGQDVSHLLSVLKLPKTKGIVVRGEFIMAKQTFNDKYKDKFANPRNMVSGVVNSNSVAAAAADMDFVVYECIVPSLSPSQQFKKLAELGFNTAYNQAEPQLTNEILSACLLDKRTDYVYEIDGIIAADDHVHPRTTGNPEHAFAFKMMLSDQSAEAKVVDVLWEPSQYGLLKPRVRIEPVSIGGVTITYITGDNAKNIVDSQIGIGAIIKVVRSGDVIPKIDQVIVPADKPKMPDVPYTWTDTNVDVVVDNVDANPIVREKKIVKFFTDLDVDGLKSGNVKKIMDAGFDTIPKILSMSQQDFEQVGFKSTAAKFVANIKERVEQASVAKLMVATGIQGIGLKTLEPLFNAFPDIASITVEEATTVAGIQKKTASVIVENIPKFIAFMNECGLNKQSSLSPKKELALEENVSTVNIEHPLNGKKIVMTKVRDKDIIASLAKYGATLEDTMKKDIFALIVKSKDDVSNKTKYATEYGIPIMTPEEFKATYFI